MNRDTLAVSVTVTLTLSLAEAHTGQFLPPGFEDERCVVLSSGLASAALPSATQTVWADVGELADIRRFREMLHKESFCLVSLNLGNNTDLVKLLAMTKPIDKHVTLAYSKEKPGPNSIIAKINRPLIWIKTDLSSGLQTSFTSWLFCPMEGKPKKTYSKVTRVCFGNNCIFNRHLELSREQCQNPFSNQIINIAADMTSPATLRPTLMKIQDLSGYNINLMKLLAEHYQFKPNIYFTNIGHFLPGNKTFTSGRYGDVLSGKADISLAAVILLFQSYFDLNLPLAFAQTNYITRAPIPMNNFANVIRPFESGVWLMIGISNLALSLVLYQIYIVYSKVPSMGKQRLARTERSHINFLLYPFAKFTEPDPLPWFKKWSTGKIVSFLWTLTSAFLVMAYVSNLRTHLTVINYTKPPNTLQDIVDSGQKVFLYTHALRQRKSFLKATGQQHSVKYKIADLAEKTNGLYDPLDHGGLHRDMPKEIIKDGAFGLVEDLARPYMYKSRPLLRQHNIHVVKEVVSTYYTTNIMRKHSPGVDKVRLITSRATEMGLINFWLTQHLPSSALAKFKVTRIGLQSFDQSHFYASSILYFSGMGLALLVFVSERVFIRFGRD